MPFSEFGSILWLKLLVLSHLAFKYGRCLNHYHVIGSSKVHTNDERGDSYSLDTSFVPSSATSALLTGWLLGRKPKNLNWSSARFLPIFSSSGISTVRATHQVFLKACFKILLTRTVHCFFFFCLMNFLSFYWGRLTSFCTPRSTNSKHTQSEQLKLISWKKRKKKSLSIFNIFKMQIWPRYFHMAKTVLHYILSLLSSGCIQKIWKKRASSLFHCQRCRKKTTWVFIVLPSCTVTIKVHILYHHQLLKTDQKWTLQNTNKEKHLNIAIQI